MNRHSLIMRICILLSIVCVLATFNIHPDVLAKENIIENNNIILDITSPISKENEYIGSIYSKTEIQKMRITIDCTELQQSNYSFSSNQSEEETNSDYKFPYNLYLHNVDYTSEEHMLQVQVEDVEGEVIKLEETIIFSNTTNSTTSQNLSEKDTKDELDTTVDKEESSKSMINVFNVNSATADAPRAKITDLKVVEGGYIGTEYKLEATGKSPNTILYQFTIQDLETNKWTAISKYTIKNTSIWKPEKAGKYRIRVRVKDSKSKLNQDDRKDYFVTVKEPKAEITDLKVSEGGYIGTEYKLTATGKSPNTILYQFTIQDLKTNKWTAISKYATKNTSTWKPEQAGKYRIRVRVKDSKSKLNQDDRKDYFVTVKEPKAKITDLKVAEGGYIGTEYKLTSTGKSPNTILYQFTIQDLKTNRWTAISKYTTKNTSTWKPEQAGKYRIRVRVKDSKSKLNQDDRMDYLVTVKENLALSGKTIMLDPGHGGYDPGAVNGSIYEKNLNNGLTKMIAKKLISLGANVIYTRNPNTDIYLSLEQRAEIANQKMPDLFISVHHDASFVKGFSIHYSSYRPNLETFGAYFQDNKGKTHHIIREVDGNAYYLENGCEKYITIKSTPYTIFDRTPSSAATNSKEFAYICYDSMKQLSFICPRNNPVSDHNLAMTRLTNMPSILIEGGPTNSTLANTNNQNAIADKMVDAIKKYFN